MVNHIGSTKINIKDRQNDHRTGNNTYKFGNAIRSYGYSNFKFELLETIKFGDIHELHDLENQYIMKYDSINNGFNTRMNTRHAHECE